MCDCCGKGCLEIKCQFKYRPSSIQQALDAKNKDFCLELSSDVLHLKNSHHFYTQIHTQIFVTESNHCDLVVWTENGFTSEQATAMEEPNQVTGQKQTEKNKSSTKRDIRREMLT